MTSRHDPDLWLVNLWSPMTFYRTECNTWNSKTGYWVTALFFGTPCLEPAKYYPHWNWQLSPENQCLENDMFYFSFGVSAYFQGLWLLVSGRVAALIPFLKSQTFPGCYFAPMNKDIDSSFVPCLEGRCLFFVSNHCMFSTWGIFNHISPIKIWLK